MLKLAESTELSGTFTGKPARRWPRRCALGLVVFFVLLGLAAGGLYWKATRDSISLNVLRGTIQTAVGARLPPEARISVGSTALSYRDGQGAILLIKDVELSLPGIARISIGELSTTTTAWALVSRQIDIRSVKATDLKVGVFGMPPMQGAAAGADAIRSGVKAFIDQVVIADDLMRRAGLQEVGVHGAQIYIADADAEATAEGPGVRISDANWLPLAPKRSKAWLQVLDKAGTSWDLTVERREARVGNPVVTVEIEDVPIGAIAPQLARSRDERPYFDSAVTLQARMVEDKDGGFYGLRGMLSAAEGDLNLSGLPGEEMHVASMALSFVLDQTGDRIDIPNGEVRTITGDLKFEGVADLSEPGFMTLVGRVRSGSLPTVVGGNHTIQITGGGGLARINFADLGIEVEQLHLSTPQGTASAIGQASFAGDAPGLSCALSITSMPADVVRAIWPPFIATKARDWFDENVKSGTVGPGTLQIALPPEFIGPQARGKVLPSYAVSGTIPFSDAEFTPIPTFPLVKGTAGTIGFGNATMTVNTSAATINVPDKGDVLAAGTTLSIPELGRHQPRGDLHLELTGPAAALAAVSDTPPLFIAKKRSIVPDNLSGDAVLSLDANIPIYKTDLADIIPTFRLTLSDFSSSSPIDSRSIEKADLVLEGSPKSYTVKGEGTLDGLRASVDLILGAGAPDKSAVSVTLDDAARARLGLTFGGLVSGPMQASLDGLDDSRQQIALDLKQTRIRLPFFGWEKGPGVPATASFLKTKTDQGIELTNFVLAGKGFEARGSLSIGADGRLDGLSLERIALRPGDQLSAKAEASGNGFNVTISGASFDARGLIRNVGSGLGGGADVFPIKVSLNVDSVRGQNDVVLSNVRGTMTIAKGGLDAASIKGNTNATQPFEWTLSRDGKTRALRLFSDGGGALIRFAGIYSRIAGGNLILDYSGPVGGAGNGVAVMRDFRVLNESALRPVLDRSSPRDSMVHSNQQSSGDLHFTQLRIPFKQKDWVISIDDAALRGSLIGATASGTINLPDSKMAVSGTLIPAFGINNIAGAIPLLGAILGGGRNEGLVGITYKLFGPLDNPELVMNPISAIAPGIFRKIFEYR